MTATSPTFRAIVTDIRKMAVTFAIALTTGALFWAVNFPAPFLMGSLFGVWIIGANMPALHPHLGVARWFHIPVVLGLGVLIGSYFNADVVSQAYRWWDTLAMMILVTLIVSSAGYLFLTRVRRYDPLMAFFCSIPGGQAEAIIIARDTVEKDYVVALFHLIRVAFVFVSTPLILGLFQGAAAVAESNSQLAQMPGLLDMPALDLVGFFTLAVSGYVIARRLRWPMPHLLGPVGASTIAHMAGIIAIPRIFEFVMLAQLAIGGAVGARLAQVRFAELRVYLRDAALTTVMILTLYFAAACLMTFVTGRELLQIWLAFVPGGLYEVTLLALLFGFDIAFVAFHHTARIILIFLAMPLAVTKLK